MFAFSCSYSSSCSRSETIENNQRFFALLRMTKHITGYLDVARHDGYGNLRPPENGFDGVDAGWDFAAISAVTTRSPSCKPSTTSVTTPSLIPVLISTGFGWLLDRT